MLSRTFWSSSRSGRMAFRRGYKVNQSSRTRQDMAKQEGISLGDYEIIGSEKNNRVHSLHPFVGNMVTLTDFRRNVVDSYNVRHKRRFKNLRKGKIQSLFSLLMHSLHYTCLPTDRLTGSVKYFRDALANEVKNNTRSQISLDEVTSAMNEKIPDLPAKVKQCISLYMYGDSNMPIYTKLDARCVLTVSTSLSALLFHAPELTYTDIQACISSVLSNTVTKSYASLQGIPKIPAFIKRDIIERSPKSDHELDILLKLYESLDGTDTSFLVLKSLICSTKIYHANRLGTFISRIVSQEKMTDQEWNGLVYTLGDNPQRVHSKEFSLILLRAQKIILDHIKAHSGNVLASGYFGMALSLRDLSRSRAEKFYDLGCQHSCTKEDEELESLVRLGLSETTDDMVENLNDSLDGSDSKNQAALWDSFFQFAHDHDLKIQHQSESINSQMTSKAISSKSTILKNLPLDQIFQRTSELDNKSISILLRKLYKHEGPILSFATGADCARYIFQLLSNPTRPIIGQMLYAESREDPAGALQRYNHFLDLYCDGFPNEKCLLSLLVPCLSIDQLNWNGIPAQRIAAHEFRKFVNPKSKDISSTIIPTGNLWRTYILLCGRFGFEDEISEVIEIWGDLRYVPDKKTLGMLLGAFPSHLGERIREHGVQHLCPENYDELTTDVWDWPSRKEIEYWRERMGSRR